MKFDTVYKDIKALSDKTDARFDRFDAKFAEVHKEIKDLSDKTDARFDKLNDKVDGLQRWAIGSVIAVIVGTIGVIVTIILK